MRRGRHLAGAEEVSVGDGQLTRVVHRVEVLAAEDEAVSDAVGVGRERQAREAADEGPARRERPPLVTRQPVVLQEDRHVEYLPGALRVVAENLNDGAGAHAVVGHALKVYADGRPAEKLVGRHDGLDCLLQFWKGYRMHQPSIFWRREVFERVGFLDERQHYIMDFDYWVRVARHFDFRNVDQILSCATYHRDAKTGDGYARYHRELRGQVPRFWGSRLGATYWRLKLSMTSHVAARSLSRVCRPVFERGRRLPPHLLRHAKPISGGRGKLG